jgi:hypothetical protein
MSNETSQHSGPGTVGGAGAISPDLDRAVVALCAAVLPLWGRHLATSRNQSEVAVAEMLSAFETIGPHLDMATRQSHQITAALSLQDGGITHLTQACENELVPVMARLDSTAAAAVQRVLLMIGQAVDALEQVARPFEHETQMVGEQVERMYVGLQYQDRISQMMTLLAEDMERLQAALLEPGTDARTLDRDAWLRSLESRYAMAEQRQNHAGPADVGTGGHNNETTFF